MNKTNDSKLRDMIENEEKYIALMSTWTDRKLSKHLDLINTQISWAWNQKNDRALKRLDAMWRQVVAARLNVLFPEETHSTGY